jgi:hypothetical protein
MEFPKALTTEAYRVPAAGLLPHRQLIRYVRDGKIHVVRVMARPEQVQSMAKAGTYTRIMTDAGWTDFESGEMVGQLITDEGIETPFSTDIPRNLK